MNVPPFDEYYPDESNMGRDQKRFYSVFRRAAQRGEFTDIGGQVSYVFCYAYELINNKEPKESLQSLIELAELYKADPKLPGYLHSWAADCAILIGDHARAIELMPEPGLGATWTLAASIRLTLRNSLNLPPEPRELIAIVGPRVTRFGRENLIEVEQYISSHIEEVKSRSENIISDWIRKFQISASPFYPFTGVPLQRGWETECITYHFSLNQEFRDFVANLIRGAENALRVDMGLPRVGEGWFSETHLYYQLKDAFKDQRVLQHARPPWLGRQHLDVYLPELLVAVEFHGAQHDGPVEFFGGQKAFEENQARDERKRIACKRNGVRLFEVRAGYDLERLIEEIKSHSE
jgi:hypothetical protein